MPLVSFAEHSDLVSGSVWILCRGFARCVRCSRGLLLLQNDAPTDAVLAEGRAEANESGSAFAGAGCH